MKYFNIHSKVMSKERKTAGEEGSKTILNEILVARSSDYEDIMDYSCELVMRY
jgi:hypothetical protein